MKKILLLLSISVLIFSCESIETTNLGTDTKWIQFDKAAMSITESNPMPLMVPVLFASDSNENGIDINFSYTSSVPTGFTVSPASGVLNIPAGEFVGYIEVTPMDDSVAGGDIVLDFTLENNTLPTGIAGENIYNHITKVTINDDDCPLDMMSFAGTYSALEDGTYNYEVTVTYDAVNDVLFLVNLYETGGDSVIRLDYSDPTNPIAYFESLNYGAIMATDGNGDYYGVDPVLLGGTEVSTFLTCNNFMDLNFRRYFPALGGAYNGVVNVQLTKN